MQYMQRGECAVLYTSVKHGSYGGHKSDLCGLRTAEILFFLCVIYILGWGFARYFRSLQKWFINFVMQNINLILTWNVSFEGDLWSDQEKKQFLKCCQCSSLGLGALDTKTLWDCHLGLEKAQMGHKEWEMVKRHVLLCRTEDTHEK